MAAAKGNQNAKGNKGGGRKSAYQELADVKELHSFWHDIHDIDKLSEELKSRKFRGRTRVLLSFLTGNERVTVEILKKIFPDLQNIQTNAEELRELTELARSIFERGKKKYVKKK